MTSNVPIAVLDTGILNSFLSNGLSNIPDLGTFALHIDFATSGGIPHS